MSLTTWSNIPSGIHISGVAIAIVPVKPWGATPTTVKSLGVDPDLAAEERRREAGIAPAVVADHDGRDARAGPFFVGVERPPGGERDAERVEVVRGDDGDERAARGVAGRHPDHRKGVGHQAVEDVAGLLANVGEVGVREGAIAIRLGAVAAEEADEITRLSRERLEHERVHEREHRAVGADPDREDEDGDEREARRLGKRPNREAQILDHMVKQTEYRRATVSVRDRKSPISALSVVNPAFSPRPT